MSTRKIYITLIAILLAGVFQLSTSLVLANDTTEVAYEISSVCDTLILTDSIIVIHTVGVGRNRCITSPIFIRFS